MEELILEYLSNNNQKQKNENNRKISYHENKF